MANLIARWTMARAPSRPGTGVFHESTASDGAAASAMGPDLVSVFANPKSLTFPVVVGLVKAAWAGAQSLPVAWVGSVWLPFAACVTLGMIVTVSNLRESARTAEGWVLGLFVGFLNCLLLFAAVLGVSPGSSATR